MMREFCLRWALSGMPFLGFQRACLSPSNSAASSTPSAATAPSPSPPASTACDRLPPRRPRRVAARQPGEPIPAGDRRRAPPAIERRPCERRAHPPRRRRRAAPGAPDPVEVPPKPKKAASAPAAARDRALPTIPSPTFQPDTFFATSKAAERYAAIVDAGGWPTDIVALARGRRARRSRNCASALRSKATWTRGRRAAWRGTPD